MRRPGTHIIPWLILALMCAHASSTVAQTTVGTLSQWNGVDGNPGFGETGDATFGQTFVVPGGAGSLRSFTFFLDDSTSMDFQTFVMAWDGTKAAGPVLFQSGVFTTTNNGGLDGFERFDVQIGGGLRLAPGMTYIAFFSVSNVFLNGTDGEATAGFVPNAYANGGFYSLNNGANFSAVTTNPWDDTFALLGFDLAFQLFFDAPVSPEVAPEQSFILVDAAAIASVMFSSVPNALAQRELALAAARTTLRDFNGRLFRRRAGAALNPADIERTYYTLTVGEGDGIEAAGGGKQVRVRYGLAQRGAPLWEIFTSFDYGGLHMDVNENLLGLQSDTYAESIGAEMLIARNTVWGGGVAYLESYSDGGTDLDGLTFVSYVSSTWHGLHADLLYAVTVLDHDIARHVGSGSRARAEPGSLTQTLSFNTGDFYSAGQWTMGPFLGVDYARAEIDGYTEQGGGTRATRVSDQTTESLISRVGLQASYRLERSWGTITPQVRVGWERENLGSDDDLTVGLLQSPYYLVQGRSISSTGEDFELTVSSEDRKRDYLTVGAGVQVELSAHFRLLLDYEGNFQGDGYTAHFGKVSLGITF